MALKTFSPTIFFTQTIIAARALAWIRDPCFQDQDQDFENPSQDVSRPGLKCAGLGPLKRRLRQKARKRDLSKREKVLHFIQPFQHNTSDTRTLDGQTNGT